PLSRNTVFSTILFSLSSHFIPSSSFLLSFFFTDTSPTEIYTLSLHDALPISLKFDIKNRIKVLNTDLLFLSSLQVRNLDFHRLRSEERTSELQSRFDLVCRLLLEKKKKKHSVRCLVINSANITRVRT